MTNIDSNSDSKTAEKQSKKTKLQPSSLRIGKRYRANRLDKDYDAIVIGSGIGGLTSAACLSKMGKKVLVLEQHYTAGGFTHSYARNGYEWDVGVHYIGDVGTRKTATRKMFDFVTDNQLQWAAMDSNYDRYYFGDEQYDLIAGKGHFIEDLKKRFPKESDAINEYMLRLNQVNKSMPLISMEKLFNGLTGRLMKMIRRAKVPDYVNKTTYEVLRELTDEEDLIAVLTGQWGDCGVPPKESSFIIHALIAKHYLHGGYYPVGGSSKMAETIIPVIQQNGGEVFTYANVTEVVVENNVAVGVQMADGTIIKAPKIISNAGVLNTFKHLLPTDVSKTNGYDKLVEKVTPSFAHLGMYIGLKDTAKNLSIPKTNFWIYPNINHTENIQRFTEDYQQEFPVVYISFPSAKDPSWDKRYPGTATVEIVAPANFEIFEKWKDQTWGKRGDDYDALKEYFSERLLKELYKKLPQLEGKIDYHELSTPLSTDFFCAYKKGEIYGLQHDPKRFEQDWLRPKTKIKGLYLTGQDIMSCGVAGAMMGGFSTSLSVLGLKGFGLIRKFMKTPQTGDTLVEFDT
jgi:all-trans-retinol 13,14-reductase